MSNYLGKAINPKTGQEEECEFLDDYFGPRQYGVRFKDGEVYQEQIIKDKQN